MTTNDNISHFKRNLSPGFLIDKVQEKGVVYCLKAGVDDIHSRMVRCFQPLRRRIHRLVYIWSWLFPSVRMFLRSAPQSKKRILAVWDFRVVPFTVGEMLVFQEMALVMRELHQVDKIDIILLCDAEQPARDDSGLNSQNFHYYFSKLLPMAFVNPHIGAVMVLDSPETLAAYIADNYDRYYIFPPYVDANGRSFTGYDQFSQYMQMFYAEHGHIPHLSCQPAMNSWAYQFLAATVRPRLPVIVQLRNTSIEHSRNARLEYWLEFFSFCEMRYDVMFVLIGDKSEIDPRFRNLPNVLVAKDHGTTVEQDMALIQTSMMYMGSTSGPNFMAMCSNLPYVIYGFRSCYEKLTPGQSMPWATPLQKLVWVPETKEQLIADFTWLYEHIDTVQWALHFDQLASDASVILQRREHFHGVVIEGMGERNKYVMDMGKK